MQFTSKHQPPCRYPEGKVEAKGPLVAVKSAVMVPRTKPLRGLEQKFQLDLFDPTTGIGSTPPSPPTSRSASGHCGGSWPDAAAHEKVLAQLKNGYAFDVLPTRNFAANSTWQFPSALAHSLMTNFQIALIAPSRRSSSKRRSLFLLRSIHALRKPTLLGRAGIVRRPQGRAILILAPNVHNPEAPPTNPCETRLSGLGSDDSRLILC